MLYRQVRSSLCGVFLVTCLSACGSESDTPSLPLPTLPTTSAEGLWTGTTNTNRTVAGLVLDNGTYWFLYSEVSTPAGLIQGDSSSLNGAFASSNAKDANLQTGVLDATINGNYTAKQSLDGTIAYQAGGQIKFTTTYNSDYDLPPDVNAVSGIYTGPVAVNETVNVTVTSAGGISGSSSTGCTFTGSFSPRAQGSAFDVTMTFGGQPACLNGSDTVRGVGFYDAGAKRLYSAALNDTRTKGFVFIGTKS